MAADAGEFPSYFSTSADAGAFRPPISDPTDPRDNGPNFSATADPTFARVCEEVRGGLCLLASSSTGRSLLLILLFLPLGRLSCDSRRCPSLPPLVVPFLRRAMTPGMNPVTTGRGGSVTTDGGLRDGLEPFESCLRKTQSQ